MLDATGSVLLEPRLGTTPKARKEGLAGWRAAFALGLSPELRTALERLLAGVESLSERIRECNAGIE